MNDLPTSTVVSQRLLGELSKPDDEAVVAALAADRALVAELRSILPLLRSRATQPAGETGVKVVIGQRLSIFPSPEFNEHEWANYWADYTEACGDLPLTALEAAMKTYVAKPDAKFMPKPGELRALALAAPFAAGRHYSIARRALDQAQENEAVTGRQAFVLTPPPVKRRPKTAEDKAQTTNQTAHLVADAAEYAEVRRRLEQQGRHDVVWRKRMVNSTAEHAAQLEGIWQRTLAAVRAGERPAARTTIAPAPVDPGGLTEAMRDALERQTGTRYPFSTRPFAKPPAVDPEVAAELMAEEGAEGFVP